MLAQVVDRWLYRHPFEGKSARRYARTERPAFGDFDDRLLDALALPAGTVLADIGCGPGTFARVASARGLRVIALDPSRDFARGTIIRARAEALPLADRAVDVAVCLSSIRHVQDRAAAMRELRRVVRAKAIIVELDPRADTRRIANHAGALGGGSLMRAAFGPLVCKTAPRAEAIARLAEAAGFAHATWRDDAIQPVYIMELVP